MKIPDNLIKKYNVPVPRYTSYPPANYFEKNTDPAAAIRAIKESNREKPSNISIYLHIPFCSKLCLYCGCNTFISHDKSLMNQYVETLKQEIALVSGWLDLDRKVTQVHWGGGTPNYLPVEKIEEIMGALHKYFTFSDHTEIAMECHPTHLTKEYTDHLIGMGFNRISLGIQDFNRKVLETVHRDAPLIPVADMVQYLRDRKISVNLDFIYGLPFQTVDSFAKSIKKAIEISPDRLVTFSYAHVPAIKKNQKILEQYSLPDMNQKIQMFSMANQMLTGSGYVFIGLDHYARPADELSLALKNKTLHRNFQGYCTREATGQVYAFGVSGISQLNNAYLQNTKDLKKYIRLINEGIPAVEKSYFLNEQEKILRKLIDELMCNLYLNWEELSTAFGLPSDEIKNRIHFRGEKLNIFKKEGLLDYDKEKVSITEYGRFFIRNITAAFDPLSDNSHKTFSKAI